MLNTVSSEFIVVDEIHDPYLQGNYFSPKNVERRRNLNLITQAFIRTSVHSDTFQTSPSRQSMNHGWLSGVFSYLKTVNEKIVLLYNSKSRYKVKDDLDLVHGLSYGIIPDTWQGINDGDYFAVEASLGFLFKNVPHVFHPDPLLNVIFFVIEHGKIVTVKTEQKMDITNPEEERELNLRQVLRLLATKDKRVLVNWAIFVLSPVDRTLTVSLTYTIKPFLRGKILDDYHPSYKNTVIAQLE